MTQRMLWIATVAITLATLLQGCGGGEKAASSEVTARSSTDAGEVEAGALPEGYVEITVNNGGVIKGNASFVGVPPSQGIIQVTKDNAAFGFDTLPDESIIVSPDGEIKNVVIFIQEINEGKPFVRTLPAVTNKGARFVPHVQTFPQREFLIRSEDPVLHNTHPYFGRKEEGGRSLYNVAMSPPPPKEVRKALKRGAGMYQLRCDAHDWMRGWIWVLDNPYGVVSGEDGTYAIDEIPPGTYKLTAWHEKLGEQEAEVTVTADGITEVNFEFSL